MRSLIPHTSYLFFSFPLAFKSFKFVKGASAFAAVGTASTGAVPFAYEAQKEAAAKIEHGEGHQDQDYKQLPVHANPIIRPMTTVPQASSQPSPNP